MTDYIDRAVTAEDIEYARLLARFGYADMDPAQLAEIVIEEAQYDEAAEPRVEFALKVHLCECAQLDHGHDVGAIFGAVLAAIAAAPLPTERVAA